MYYFYNMTLLFFLATLKTFGNWTVIKTSTADIYLLDKSCCKMQQLDVSAEISILWLRKYCLIRKTGNPLLNI